MAILEKVMQLRQTGMNDSQIIQNLQEEGVTPRDINEALSQSKIKYEIYNDQNQNEETSYQDYSDQGQMQQQRPQNMMNQRQMQSNMPMNGMDSGQMQPSMSQSMMGGGQSQQNKQQPGEFEQEMPRPEYIPSPNEQYEQPVEDYQDNQNAQEYYPEYQPEYQEYQPSAAIDIETINEVAEQIVEEKQDKIRKEITSFSKFKEEISFDVQRMNIRLEKIEKTIDELQIAILRRIGDYGRDIQNISKELHATQNSFSKVLDPLTDNIRELQRITGDMSEKDVNKKDRRTSEEPDSKEISKKSKEDFNDYLMR